MSFAIGRSGLRPYNLRRRFSANMIVAPAAA
jgi:hypothetical protein